MPTLARLSFWVSPEHMDTFEATYKKKIVPILKKHDLVESSERGRRTAEGVFSRLFEVETPSEVAVKERALQKDPVWGNALQDLGTAFGTTQSDGLMRTYFGLYRTPAGPGRTVEAGMGVRQGSWQTLGPRDGLLSSAIYCMVQDREGDLWFGVEGGVCRYDGEAFLSFTTEDGLAGKDVRAMFEDRDGNLWLGTWRGVSRYDGEQFVTFTAEDGLGDDWVWSILEDWEGHLWFGTGRLGSVRGGVSRYDPSPIQSGTRSGGPPSPIQSGTRSGGTPSASSGGAGEPFVTFTTEHGLLDNHVHAMFEDRDGNLWFGTGGGGVSRYDRAYRSDRGAFVTFTIEEGSGVGGVTSILQDSDGYLWFGTGGGGVSRYDPSTGSGGPPSPIKSGTNSGGTGEELVTFTTEEGLAGNEVYSMVEDREGCLWFAAFAGGRDSI